METKKKKQIFPAPSPVARLALQAQFVLCLPEKREKIAACLQA